ncbi:MAG: c-type cytochrome biogenesis protein CcmI [Hansschlegelia sp.]
MTALWVTVAIMTGAAVFVVLGALTRRRGTERATAADVAVYRDQLDEIQRDRARGLINDREAEAARAEVARRLLAASEAANKEGASSGGADRRRRIAALSGLVGAPLIALGSYALLGRPEMPDLPLAGRLESQPKNPQVADLVARVEAALAKNPDDVHGWTVIAPVYLATGRAADAAEAYGNIIRLSGNTPDRMADYGEALFAAADGVVTANARAAFEASVASDKPSIKGAIYLARASQQDGDPERALARLRPIIETAPADAPYLSAIRRELERLAGVPPLPMPTVTPEDRQKTPEERMAMIRSMVDGLGDRLKANGGDLGEWLRLASARAALGDAAAAKAALSGAREKFGEDGRAKARIDALGLGLGLEGPGA